MTERKVKDDLNYVKIDNTASVVNKNFSAYHARRKKIAHEKKREAEITSMREQISQLQDLIEQINKKV